MPNTAHPAFHYQCSICKQMNMLLEDKAWPKYSGVMDRILYGTNIRTLSLELWIHD